MSCAIIHDHISAYIDDEASAVERAEVDAHVAACAACAAQLESYRAMKHGIGGLAARRTPPPAIHARVESLRFRRHRRTRRTWLIASAAAVAAVALAVAAASLEPAPAGSGELAAELVADHLKYAPQAMPAEVASADATEVRAFFADKVAFAPAAPRLPGAQLLGGRLCNIDGHKVQLLFYEQGSRRLSLYVSDRALTEGCSGPGPQHVCGRAAGGVTLTLVGDGPPENLRRLLAAAEL